MRLASRRPITSQGFSEARLQFCFFYLHPWQSGSRVTSPARAFRPAQAGQCGLGRARCPGDVSVVVYCFLYQVVLKSVAVNCCWFTASSKAAGRGLPAC